MPGINYPVCYSYMLYQLFPSQLEDSPCNELLGIWKKRTDKEMNLVCPFIYALTSFLLCQVCLIRKKQEMHYKYKHITADEKGCPWKRLHCLINGYSEKTQA